MHAAVVASISLRPAKREPSLLPRLHPKHRLALLLQHPALVVRGLVQHLAQLRPLQGPHPVGRWARQRHSRAADGGGGLVRVGPSQVNNRYRDVVVGPLFQGLVDQQLGRRARGPALADNLGGLLVGYYVPQTVGCEDDKLIPRLDCMVGHLGLTGNVVLDLHAPVPDRPRRRQDPVDPQHAHRRDGAPRRDDPVSFVWP
mmetsp:Transcript_9959/g.24320  ORF Transcript_9959/g.24320 Transcript_9959/m.24320 type:complete len:200 (-) Transcript_9959:487-1086(-)